MNFSCPASFIRGVFQRRSEGGRVGMWVEAKRGSLAIASGWRDRRAFFQHQTELFPEGLYFFTSSFASFPAFAERVWLGRCADYALPCCLPGISRGDVQRQVVRINQAAHETQQIVRRRTLLGIVHANERAVRTASDHVFVIAVPESRCLRRDIQQAGVLLLTFHAVCGSRSQRIGEIMRDVLTPNSFVLVVF